MGTEIHIVVVSIQTDLAAVNFIGVKRSVYLCSAGQRAIVAIAAAVAGVVVEPVVQD